LDSKVLALYFEAPKSFTGPSAISVFVGFLGSWLLAGEDVLEFQVHGNPTVVNEILQSIPRCLPTPDIAGNGVIRLAEEGEFTRRAFMNGKV
jgi:tRNA U34 5-carboxymethylaminomethyl modifying GTPase MnmE/TrmE